jgi:hypothetical protein
MTLAGRRQSFLSGAIGSRLRRNRRTGGGWGRIENPINNPTVPTKDKVSVTISGDLLSEVDRLCGKKNRNQVLKEALSWWVRRQSPVELDRAIEFYYRSLGRSERKEDRDWAELGDETVRSGWSR